MNLNQRDTEDDQLNNKEKGDIENASTIICFMANVQ